MADTSLTGGRAYWACQASFPCWKYCDDIDRSIPADKDERHPSKGVYAVWFRDRVEADHELKNMSVNDILREELKTITFPEREVLELIYHMETGQHLDIENWTLCSGSRGSDGDVPSARWSNGRFGILWYYHGYRHPFLRSREEVFHKELSKLLVSFQIIYPVVDILGNINELSRKGTDFVLL